jgi:hypothetical protein
MVHASVPAIFFVASLAVACSVAPQVAEAGPCSSDIAELETTIQQPGVKALGPGQQSVNIQLGIQAAQESSTRADEHLQSQFSATVARAKRLDRHSDRIGCTGALNAARHMYVLVAAAPQANIRATRAATSQRHGKPAHAFGKAPWS